MWFGVVCGLTNKTDRSEDEKIVFKDGKCCACKLDDFWKQLETASTRHFLGTIWQSMYQKQKR